MWHQLNEVLSLEPNSVLELGPGPGLFKQMVKAFGTRVETLDIDPELNPDHVGSATEMPFKDESFDVVCAFQVLEHLPYDMTLKAFSEMARVGKKNIVISLPDAKTMWRYLFHVPKFGEIQILIPRPRLRPLVHVFDGEHYWEINKRGYPLSRIIDDLTVQGTRILRTYRVKEYPYHRLFIFEIN